MTLADTTGGPLWHAACAYTVRGARALSPIGRTVRLAALCGASIGLDEPTVAARCPACMNAAEAHAAVCDCFRLYPDTARLPRRPQPRLEVTLEPCRHLHGDASDGRCAACGVTL